MIVHHLCTSLSGGASVAAQRLHASLQDQGVDSRFWHSSRGKPTPVSAGMHEIEWTRPAGWLARTAESIRWCGRRAQSQWFKLRYLRHRPGGFELFTPARLAYETEIGQTPFSGDILHLHWVAKLIDYPSFFGSVPWSTPVVWTLHDMNPFTGGCHFSAGCSRFESECGHCPQIAHSGENDWSHRQWLEKRDAIRNVQLHVVAPSRWLLNAARRSTIFAEAQSFHLIPYGIRTDRFVPRPKSQARRALSLSPESRVIGFGADSVTNRRKGWSEMLSALQSLSRTESTVAVVFGGGDLPAGEVNGVKILPVGFVRGEDKLAEIYSALDFFVLPSLEDNLPQTGLEAMSCGTPVVAFDVGGIPDFVIDGRTGRLARTVDPSELARQMQWMLDRPAEASRMGQQARQWIVERFDSPLEAARYRDLYRQITAMTEDGRRHAA